MAPTLYEGKPSSAPTIQRTTTKAVQTRRLSFSTLVALSQLRVLGLGLLQDGDVGVGVLPERQEVFVGS